MVMTPPVAPEPVEASMSPLWDPDEAVCTEISPDLSGECTVVKTTPPDTPLVLVPLVADTAAPSSSVEDPPRTVTSPPIS